MKFRHTNPGFCLVSLISFRLDTTFAIILLWVIISEGKCNRGKHDPARVINENSCWLRRGKALSGECLNTGG